MKLHKLILVAVATACVGCYSKEPSGTASGAVTNNPANFTSTTGSASGIPEELRALRLAIPQHTGDITDWRITMSDFASGFRKWAHPEAKIVWERDGQDKWIMRLTRYDKVTQTEGRMIMAFKKVGNKAVLYRYVLDDKEYYQEYIATLVNDVVYGVLQSMGKLDMSKRLPASE